MQPHRYSDNEFVEALGKELEGNGLGPAVRYLRLLAGRTQKGLAESAGIAYSSLVSYEGGKSKLTPKALAKIGKALEVPIAEILMLAQRAEEGVEFKPQVCQGGHHVLIMLVRKDGKPLGNGPGKRSVEE